MQQFCDVLPQAFAASFPEGPQAESSGSEDPGAELGAPADQTKVWRKLARKRQRKAAHFLEDKRSQWLTLLWATLTAPVMVVHYKLFKRGTWFTERPEPVEGEASVAAASFRDAGRQAAVDLSNFLSQTDTVQVPAWTPLVGAYGPVLSWPQDRLRATRRSILTLLGQLWRKLLEPWNRYPWRLVGLRDQTPEQQQEKARLFFAEKQCCLDCFSSKLRLAMPTPAELLDPKCLEFLDAVFDRVVPTSTAIERAFARLSSWCDKKGQKPHLFTLAAKHTTHQFKHLTELWRSKCRKNGTLPKKPSNLCRPDWAYGVRKGRSLNGVHVFAKEKGLAPGAGLMRRWNLLSRQERKHFASLARARNAQTKALSVVEEERKSDIDSLRGGFWNMSSPTGFPMLKERVQPHLQNMKAEVKSFVQQSGSLRPEEPEGFQGAPAMNSPLWSGCQPELCPHELPNDRQVYFDSFQVMFLEIIYRKAPKPSSLAEEPLVLEFSSVQADKTFYVAVAFNTRKKPIEAVLLDVFVVDGLQPPGTLMVLACERQAAGQLALLGHVEFGLRLAKLASDWKSSILTVGPVRQMHHFDIVASEPVDWEAMQEELAREKELKKTLAALKQMTKTNTKQTVPHKRAPPTAKGGNAENKRSKISKQPASDHSDDFKFAGSSQSVSESDVESDTVPDPVAKAKGPASHVPRHKQRRGRLWGTRPAFQIAPIHAGGSSEATGWGAICGLHWDPDRPGLQCKKAMSNSGLSDAECQLRLKRWLVAGIDSSHWGSNKREAHVSLGGVQLAQFATGLDSASLDQTVGHAG